MPDRHRRQVRGRHHYRRCHHLAGDDDGGDCCWRLPGDGLRLRGFCRHDDGDRRRMNLRWMNLRHEGDNLNSFDVN